MGTQLRSPNHHTPLPGPPVEDAVHPGRITRAALWLVNVGTPKLIPDRLTAPIRQHTHNADDQLEQTARRLVRSRVNRGPTKPDRHTR
jgi:hypothetical protein